MKQRRNHRKRKIYQQKYEYEAAAAEKKTKNVLISSRHHHHWKEEKFNHQYKIRFNKKNESTLTNTTSTHWIRRKQNWKFFFLRHTIFRRKRNWFMHHQHILYHEGENLLFYTRSRERKRRRKLHHKRKYLKQNGEENLLFTDKRGKWDEEGAHLIPHKICFTFVTKKALILLYSHTTDA